MFFLKAMFFEKCSNFSQDTPLFLVWGSRAIKGMDYPLNRLKAGWKALPNPPSFVL